MDCICSKRVFTGSRNPKPASDILLTQGSGDGYDACIHLLTNQQVTWPEYQLAMVPKTRSGVRPEGRRSKKSQHVCAQDWDSKAATACATDDPAR